MTDPFDEEDLHMLVIPHTKWITARLSQLWCRGKLVGGGVGGSGDDGDGALACLR